MIFGWGGNGFGGNTNNAEMQAGFNNSEIIGKLDRLGDGLASGFYAQNTNLLESFNQNQRDMCTGFSAVTNAITTAQAAATNCCCETNRNIDSVRYENAMNTAAINANIDSKFAALEKAQLEAQIQAQQSQINQLYLNSQLCGVVRYPLQTTYSGGYSPFFGYGGCSQGNI
jgi:hypothetical protein